MPSASRKPELDPRVADASLDRLRGHRVRTPRDLSLSDLAAKARECQRASKNLGGAARAWEAACPPDLLPRTRVVALSRGVLTIGVDGSSTRYALDRAMRSGGLLALRQASNAAISKVKYVERIASARAGR